jgi:hypothetical protein
MCINGSKELKMSNYIAPNGESTQLVTLTDINGTPVNPAAGPVSTTVTAVFDIETGPFTVAAGFSGLAIANIGIAAGVLDGKAFPSGSSLGWDIVQGATYNAISGDATGTTFQIAKVV